jgi:hypothetical protein
MMDYECEVLMLFSILDVFAGATDVPRDTASVASRPLSPVLNVDSMDFAGVVVNPARCTAFFNTFSESFQGFSSTH